MHKIGGSLIKLKWQAHELEAMATLSTYREYREFRELVFRVFE